MPSLIAFLNSPAFSVLNQALSVAEVLGFATGLWCVWLTARKSILNFPVGIANSALLLLLFSQTRLFADATLQILFIVLSARGWWLWAQVDQGVELPISNAPRRIFSAAIVLSLLLSATIGGLLFVVRGSIPVFDGLITGLSLVAQWLLNRRLVQSWYWWIAVDVISIPVYIYKELYLIALLYAVFL
ncbi:MAG TPA: nicotinamide riboside transporter PnuC, partial [Steroidobacteraceae bacterium]|nr:nicotinamide riboside transporter PnuC [Steroidobacteraceae bacterium]